VPQYVYIQFSFNIIVVCNLRFNKNIVPEEGAKFKHNSHYSSLACGWIVMTYVSLFAAGGFRGLI